MNTSGLGPKFRNEKHILHVCTVTCIYCYSYIYLNVFTFVLPIRKRPIAVCLILVVAVS